jgi:predicted nucleotidyltransferase
MKLTSNITTIALLESELQKFSQFDFALLFGSFAEGTNNELSDIDLGIHFHDGYSLLDLGAMTASLEAICGKRVDGIPLNGLYKTNPAFAFEVVAKGTVLCCRNSERLTDFKTKTFLYYLDAKPMLESVKAHFLRRLDNEHFAEPHYARQITAT